VLNKMVSVLKTIIYLVVLSLHVKVQCNVAVIHIQFGGSYCKIIITN